MQHKDLPEQVLAAMFKKKQNVKVKDLEQPTIRKGGKSKSKVNIES